MMTIDKMPYDAIISCPAILDNQMNAQMKFDGSRTREANLQISVKNGGYNN